MRLHLACTIVPVLLGAVCCAQPGPRMRPPEGVEVRRDVVYATIGDRELHMDLAWPTAPPKLPMPVIVHIHGGAFKSGDHHGPQNYGAAARGYFTANIEYRLSGEAIFPAQIHDCKAAIRYLRAHATEYRLDPDHIGVWGSSAGGCLAALVGTSAGVPELEGAVGDTDQPSAVQAVVDLFGPSDFTTLTDAWSTMDHAAPDSPESLLLGGPLLENLDRAKVASPLTYVDSTDPPSLIVHGDGDPIVPWNQSDKLHRALQAAGVESTFITVKGGGHGFSEECDPPGSKVNAMVLEFFDRKLRGQGTAPE